MVRSGGEIDQSIFINLDLFQKIQEHFPSGTGPSLALPDCPHGIGGPHHLRRRDQALRPQGAASLSAYDLAPEALLPLFTVGLPLIETVAGLNLVFVRPWRLHQITGLLALFVFALGSGILGDEGCRLWLLQGRGAEQTGQSAGGLLSRPDPHRSSGAVSLSLPAHPNFFGYRKEQRRRMF